MRARSPDNDSNDVEDLSDLGEFDQMEPSEPSARASEQEPDVPPPPYSSHDPSLDAHAPCDAEASLRNLLEQLRVNCKQHETTLLSSIAALRKTNDKLTREDQRLRQRIHMLEDSTLRLREVASEEASESLLLEEAISELEEAEKSLQSRLEHRREELEKQERNLKEECDRSDTEANLLNDRLEKASAREEEVLGRKLKLERELLPTYNIQLVSRAGSAAQGPVLLDADLSSCPLWLGDFGSRSSSDAGRLSETTVLFEPFRFRARNLQRVHQPVLQQRQRISRPPFALIFPSTAVKAGAVCGFLHPLSQGGDCARHRCDPHPSTLDINRNAVERSFSAPTRTCSCSRRR